jgi:hypothetical protein
MAIVTIDITDITEERIYSYLGNEAYCPKTERELREMYSSVGFITFEYNKGSWNSIGIVNEAVGYSGFGFRMSIDGNVTYQRAFNGEDDLGYSDYHGVNYVPYSTVPPEPEHDYLTSPIDFKGVDEEAQMKYIESFMKQIEAISQKLSIKPVKGDLVNTLQAEWVSTDDPKYLDVPYDEAKKAIIEDSKDRSDYGYFLIERTGYVKRTENRHGRLCVNDGSRWVRIWKVLDKNTLLEKTIDPTEVKTLVSGLRALCTANNYTEGDEILSLMEAEYVPKD